MGCLPSTVGIMIDLLIPKETPSANTRERWHWRQQRREVTEWEYWFNSTMRPVIDRAKGPRLVTIHAFRTRRCSDEANFVSGCKGMIDGLVRAGLLVDDSRSWVKFTYIEQVASKSPTGRACTRVVITEDPGHQESAAGQPLVSRSQ